MASVKFECKASKVNNDGKAPVYLRINTGKQRAYIATGIHIAPGRWNQTGQEIRKFKTRTENSEELNAQLSDMRTKALLIIKQYPEAAAAFIKKETEAATDPEAGEYGNQVNLLQYAEKKNEEIKQSSFNYYKRRGTAINHLKTYTKNRGVEFVNINRQWILTYFNWLREDKKQKPNTAIKNIRVLSQFFNQAIKEHQTDKRNPFDLVSFKKEKTMKNKLTKEEFKAIETLKLPEGSLIWNIRNYFCAQVYLAGCRISDLATLQKKNIIGERILYKMQKTRSPHSVIITPPLQQLINVYINHYPDIKNLFPLLDKDVDKYRDHRELSLDVNRKASLCNKYLKKIREKAGINKKITTHIARHTFADLARKSGWSIYDISKALNHSSLSITERYLADLDTDGMDRGMKGLFR